MATKKLFLDTNVLLELLFDSNNYLKKMIGNCKLIGCQILVSRRTIEEYKDFYDRSKKTLRNLRANSKQYAMATNPFVHHYGILLQQGKNTSKKDFMEPFSDIEEAIKGFGLEIFEEDYSKLKELPNYNQLVREVQKCYAQSRDKEKKKDIAEHDAFHLLLVKQLRDIENKPLFGPNYWFLSRDLTLAQTDKFIRNNFDFQDKATAVMIPSLWNEIISPLLIGIVTQKDLVDVFVSFILSDFVPISEGINAGVLAKLEVDWSEYGWLEEKEINEIVNSKFVIDYLSKAEMYTKSGDSEALEEIRREFNISFSRVVGAISNRKVSSANEALRKKVEENEQLESQVLELKTSEKTLKENLNSEQTLKNRISALIVRMRYLSGFLSILSIATGLILLYLLRDGMTYQWVAIVALLLLSGVILLLMAIAPEQVTGNLAFGTKSKS